MIIGISKLPKVVAIGGYWSHWSSATNNISTWSTRRRWRRRRFGRVILKIKLEQTCHLSPSNKLSGRNDPKFFVCVGFALAWLASSMSVLLRRRRIMSLPPLVDTLASDLARTNAHIWIEQICTNVSALGPCQTFVKLFSFLNGNKRPIVGFCRRRLRSIETWIWTMFV